MLTDGLCYLAVTTYGFFNPMNSARWTLSLVSRRCTPESRRSCGGLTARRRPQRPTSPRSQGVLRWSLAQEALADVCLAVANGPNDVMKKSAKPSKLLDPRRVTLGLELSVAADSKFLADMLLRYPKDEAVRRSTAEGGMLPPARPDNVTSRYPRRPTSR